MARALLVVALALGGAALTPPPPPKTPVTGRQAVVKERKQLLPPTVAPLVVETVPDGPLLADAPPLLDEGGTNQGPPSLKTTTIPPIPDELEDAVRKRSAEEQAEKAKEQVKIARSKKKGDWYKFGFQTKESQAQPEVTIDVTVPEGARAGDIVKVTVPQDVDVLEYLGVTEPKPCVTSDESENSVAKELAGFTLPLLLVWLASPLLSLVDTAAVGASRPTAELAVLGPACAACDNAAFLCTFLGIVTTGAVSRALATGDETKAKTASGAACVAALVVGGLLTAAACSPLGPAGLGAMVPRSTPGFSAAVAYTRIRSLAFVPALLIMVLQSTSLVRGPRPLPTRFDSWRECYFVIFRTRKNHMILSSVAYVTPPATLVGRALRVTRIPTQARRNVRAPLKAAGLSGAANLVGDGILVPTMGLAGAALATTAAQIVALIALLQDAAKGKFLPSSPRQWARSAGAPLRQIFTKGAPVVAALSAKTAVLLSLSYAAASTATKRGDLAALAAHQILVGLYFVFAPVGDALSQTVQTFLPRSIVADQLDEVDRPPQKRSKALGPKSRAVVKGAVAAALVLGGLDAVMAWGLPAGLPTLFSRDPAVHSALRRTAPYLGSALMVHGLSSATEGTMLANRDAGVLGGLYAFDAAVVVAAFFAVAKAAGPVTSVWRVFLGYNLLRCSQFALRVTSTALRRRKTA